MSCLVFSPFLLRVFRLGLSVTFLAPSHLPRTMIRVLYLLSAWFTARHPARRAWVTQDRHSMETCGMNESMGERAQPHILPFHQQATQDGTDAVAKHRLLGC